MSLREDELLQNSSDICLVLTYYRHLVALSSVYGVDGYHYGLLEQQNKKEYVYICPLLVLGKLQPHLSYRIVLDLCSFTSVC